MTSTILEEILRDENIAIAIQAVQSKGNPAGSDGILPSDLNEYWKLNGDTIKKQIREGVYEPDYSTQFERVSRKGKKRGISLLCACDRMLARAAVQVIAPIIDKQLSCRCYSYRNGLGTVDMAMFVSKCIERGDEWCAELDVKDFFDTIPHERLIEQLRKAFDDEILVRFLHSFIASKIQNDGAEYRLTKGILQGSPLSPLFSNIFLMQFDNYGEERYDGYCRYGDDIRVLVKSKAAAEEALKDLTQRIREDGMSVNQGKSGAFRSISRSCLGYEFSRKDGNVLVSRIVRQKPSVNHNWQKTALRKIDHHYHIVSDGILTKKDFSLLFENEQGKTFLPVGNVHSLNVYSNVVFAERFFELADSEGFCVSIISRNGELVGRFIPSRWRRGYKAEIEQIAFLQDEKRKIRIARVFQKANIFNLRAVLRYYQRKGHPEFDNSIEELSKLMDKIEKAVSVNQTMIYEAQAKQIYYQCFNRIMPAEGFKFEKRTRRPPKDALNAMISFGNTLLYNRFAYEIYRSKLDIRFGIIHNSTQRPENLNLDLADLFKPVLVDRTIFTLVNRRMINEKQDFEETGEGGVYLSHRGKRIFLQEFDRKLQQAIRKNSKQTTYDDLIRSEVGKVQEFFLHGGKYRPYKYVN